ncbi:hypothetical protein [Phytohabitans rumicis]|nr:hypothetical protein [Phytohabitans rumicis]
MLTPARHDLPMRRTPPCAAARRRVAVTAGTVGAGDAHRAY